MDPTYVEAPAPPRALFQTLIPRVAIRFRAELLRQELSSPLLPVYFGIEARWSLDAPSNRTRRSR